MAIFLDTGVLYALHDMADARHLDASAIAVHALKGKWGSPYLSNYVALETMLLLRSKLGWGPARSFPSSVKEMGVRELVVDEQTHSKALTMFAGDGHELSLTDTASLLLMDELGIGTFATFDRRSFGMIGQNIVGTGYASTLSDEEKDEVARFSRAKASSQ